MWRKRREWKEDGMVEEGVLKSRMNIKVRPIFFFVVVVVGDVPIYAVFGSCVNDNRKVSLWDIDRSK